MDDDTLSTENNISFDEFFASDPPLTLMPRPNSIHYPELLSSSPKSESPRISPKYVPQSISPKYDLRFNSLINAVNIFIITYNTNLMKYRQLAKDLERQFNRIVVLLKNTYVNICISLSNLISSDISNISFRNYDNILSYIRKGFAAFAVNLNDKFNILKNNLVQLETTLARQGQGIIQMIWTINYPRELKIFFSGIKNYSSFIRAINTGIMAIFSETVSPIMNKFTRIDWLYGRNEKTTNYFLTQLKP